MSIILLVFVGSLPEAKPDDNLGNSIIHYVSDTEVQYHTMSDTSASVFTPHNIISLPSDSINLTSYFSSQNSSSHCFVEWNSYKSVSTSIHLDLLHVHDMNSHSVEILSCLLWDLILGLGLKPNMYSHFKFKYLPVSIIFARQKTKIIYHPGKQASVYLCLLLLMQAGDCELNPGPTHDDSSCSKFPCIICHEPCTWSQRAVQCDECDGWYHVQCMSMESIVYEGLGGSNVSWICCNCGIANFSTSLFSN